MQDKAPHDDIEERNGEKPAFLLYCHYNKSHFLNRAANNNKDPANVSIFQIPETIQLRIRGNLKKIAWYKNYF
jgi:hypothetical protein